MTSPGLVHAARALLDREEEIDCVGKRLSADLYRAVATEPDRKRRAQVILLRRELYGSVKPLSGQTLDAAVASTALSTDAKASLVRHANDRLEFERQQQQFEELYQQAITRERAELFSIASDETFRKAIYVASPGTLAALTRLPSASPKQRRRLEETLHSYLMRAVGRPAPNGVWSGMTIEGHADSQSRVVFAVRLEPFADALKAIASRDPWRAQVPLRVNPTLRRRNAREFEYFHQAEWHCYESSDVRLTEQLAQLSSHTQVCPGAVYGMEILVGLGILLPTLELPGLFSDSWSALYETIPRLPVSEQKAWNLSLHHLRKLAEQLGLEYDSLPLETLQYGMTAARRIVNALLAPYGVAPVPEDQNVLVADRRVALSSEISLELRARLGRAIRSYWSFDRYGMGEEAASSERRCMFGELPQIGITFEDLASRYTAKAYSHDGAGHMQRWVSELAPVAHQHQHTLSNRTNPFPLPPGSALVRFDAAGHLRIGSVTPDPCLFYSRFNALFRTGVRSDLFCEWYKTGIQETESTLPGLVFADVAVPSLPNPNSAARLNMTGRLLDVSREGHRSLRIYSDATEWPKLRSEQAGPAIVPRLHSAAIPDRSDVRTRAIQEFSLLIGRPSLLRPLPRFKEEIENWHHLPRLTLDDFVLCAERWTPPTEFVHELQRASGSARFLVWQKYARTANLPDLLYIASGGADSELLLQSGSPLAVDLLGNRLTKHGGPLLVQEAWPSPFDSWLQDERGRHYSVELALAWHGDPDFWIAYLGYTKQ